MTKAAAMPLRTFTERHPGRLFIGGEWLPSLGDERLDVIHPATGQRVATVTAATTADVERAVTAAYDAFHKGAWPLLPVSERAAVLRRLATELRRRSADLSSAITLEMGAPIRETACVPGAVAGLCDYYADLAESLPELDHRPWQGGRACVAHRPVGVVAAIVPWNAPLSLTLLKLAPALAAGCTLVVKAAPSTPLDALILAECVEAAEVPPGVVSILPGGNEAGDALVRDPRVDKVTFTGSTGVGRHIGAICGERIARQALELGGKSAAILLDDMDVEAAALRLVPGCMRLTGQACSALTRVLVPRRRQAAFVEAFAVALRSLRMGDPFRDDTTLGPLALERQRDRVEGYVAAGIEQGARLVSGGGRPSHLDPGFFLEPTLFDQVDNSMTIARDEIFGPVVSVLAYDGEDEAVAIANDSPYGLYASLFTADENAVLRLAPRLRAGNVSRAGLYIDRTLPYGGFKESGVGREGGIEGLRSFQEVQTLYLPI